MKSNAEYGKEYRERMTKKGLKARLYYVYPEIAEKVKGLIEKMNKHHEKTNSTEAEG